MARIFKKILITGASGSGASYLIEQLIKDMPHAELHGISRWHSTSSKNNNLQNVKNNITIHDCDLTDFSSLLKVLSTVKPDAIFHLASSSSVNASYKYPLSVLNNNIMGTANLFEIIKTLRENDSTFDPYILMCSTSEVYGIVNSEVPMNELFPLQPSNPYSVSKLTQDAIAYSYFKSYGIKSIRTRAFTYFNPRRIDIFATAFARQIVEIELGIRDVLYHGNLESTRTVIDARDCMSAYIECLTKCTVGEVYNIGGSHTIKVGDFLQTLISNSSVNIKTEIDKSLLRPVDITYQVPDTSKFRNETGWKEKYSYEESVKFFLDTVRKNVISEYNSNK